MLAEPCTRRYEQAWRPPLEAHVEIKPWRTSVSWQVMLHPYRTYQAVREAEPAPASWRQAIRGPAMWLLMLTAFVSLTTAGRLVWFHIVMVGAFWLYFPGLTAFWVAVTSHRRGEPIRSMGGRIDRYFLGYAPWYLWMLFVSGMCLFPAYGREAIEWMGFGFFVPMLLAIVWGIVTTHACFRAGFGFGRWESLGRTLAFYVGFAGSIVGYYWGSDQLRNLMT
ncbi:MAG: hypothetical protein ACI9MR_000094 [Myxococcota bacterium]|jgi:hypothetical protein